MDSRRSSSSQEAKLDEKLDEDHLGTIPSQTNDANDIEKGAESDQPNTSTDNHNDAFLVKWEENDSSNPRTFSPQRKAFITFILGMLALSGSLGSSIISPAEDVLAEKFNVSSEVMVLCISLYVLGFALGPSLWAPISEVYGRKISILPAVLCLGILSIGTAVSQNAASVFITRFLSGVFGSAPISNVSAALGDLYEPQARGVAVTFYAVCVTGGPTLGPVIGSALTVTPSLGWRWTEYISAIFTFFILGVAIVAMPELYHPVLLERKAKRMRKETGDQRFFHPHEKERMTINNIVTKHLSRPVKMLFTEPMVTAIALYASFVYGLLYMTLEVFPIVYLEERQWGLVLSTLPFLGLLVGVVAALFINLANQPRYARAVKQNNGKAVPEARLPPMIVGGFLFVIGLFWFGWTADPKIHWAVPTVATCFIGAGFNIIFQQCINFLVDTYSLYAASAVSANTLLRSLFACGLPLAAKPMYRALGVGPGTSVLGGVAVLALPVPFMFMRYGAKLRSMSRFAPTDG